MNSIQRHLSVGLFSVLIVVGLVLAQTSLWLFDEGLRRYIANNLRTEAQTLLGVLERNEQHIQLNPAHLSSAYERPFSGNYFLVQIPAQQWRSRSLWDYSLILPVKTGLQTQLADGPQAQRLLVYRAEYRRFGETIDIVVAQDYTPMLESFRRLQWLGGGLGIAALLIILLLQRLLVAHALRPLEDARQQIAQLQNGQRATLDNNVPDELLPLVKQINHLLQHTEATLKRSRTALGNLGHALKTPLAVLFSLSTRRELKIHTELHQNLLLQLENIQQRLSRELGRARLAGEVLPGAYFVCSQEIPDLMSTLAQIHARSLQLEWQAPADLRLPWDREDILELLGNLLDNACKWAASHVALEIEISAGHFCLYVDDDGPGIAVENRADVLNRGIRVDEQIAGHGLGLAIVRDIVAHCGGDIDLMQSALGGLRVAIRLPAPIVA